MMHAFRRKMALMICPEIKMEMAALRVCIPKAAAIAEKLSHLKSPVVSSAKVQILTLCDALAAHDNVTHWAISKRLMGKGDYFQQLRLPNRDMRSATFERLIQDFSKRWPEDLEWPTDIPRPTPEQKDAS